MATRSTNLGTRRGRQQHPKRIGFVSTRFAGTDGVSLETAKWAQVFEEMGHTCFYLAGQCDRPAERSQIVPELFYRHPDIDAINKIAYNKGSQPPNELDGLIKEHFYNFNRPPSMTRRVDEFKQLFKAALYQFARDFELDLLVTENALTIPINIPLGLALTEFIAETGIPTIAHHHDFAWERQRFQVNCVQDYIAAAFPPRLPSVWHVVINTVQAHDLARRIGANAVVIPNVMDFDTPPAPPDDYTKTVRQDLGIADGQYFLLQPTRIIQRKGIEHAIELASRLGLNSKLVISHASGDEGDAYEQRVRQFAEMLNIPVGFEADIVQDARGTTPDGRRIYTLGDVYPHADLVTYPSTIEGFGNAFLEAVYYRRPIIVNNYSIYEVDIRPKGFHVIEFDGFISDATVEDTRQLLLDPARAEAWAEENYALARRYFSYSALRHNLEVLLGDAFGTMAELD